MELSGLCCLFPLTKHGYMHWLNVVSFSRNFPVINSRAKQVRLFQNRDRYQATKNFASHILLIFRKLFAKYIQVLFAKYIQE